ELRTTMASAPDQLTVAYQPLVDLSTGRTVGFEALVRWAHPSRGLLLPAEFLSVAEETDLIDRVGRHVITTAVGEFTGTAWTDGLGLSVNMWSRELCDRRVPAGLAALISDTGIAPERLCIEVTETGFVLNDDDVVAAAR